MGTTKNDKNEKSRMEYGLLESGEVSLSKSFIFNRDDISSSKHDGGVKITSLDRTIGGGTHRNGNHSIKVYSSLIIGEFY